MIAPLADNIVWRQLPRLIADAEALLSVAAWPDLPAGCRIIGIDGSRLAGFCSGSGHRFAQAHGCRPGAVAVGVAAEDALRSALDVWADELPAALGEAAVAIELVAAHEAAHALVADIDGELQPGQGDILRGLPSAVGTVAVIGSAERTARDHGARWAAGLVILSQRCRQYRPRARHRWNELLENDLQAVGIDTQAVADAVGDVADEVSLRDLLAAGGMIAARVAEAIPDETTRAALIAARWEETLPVEPGHVAPVAVGEAEEFSSWRSTSSE
jgi:hypothetical protein